MSLRKPLVIVGGQIEQIQSGDTLDAIVTEQELITLTNDESSDATVIGMPVYIDAADGCKQAKADAAATTKTVALCKDASITAGQTGTFLTSGILSATTAQWDAVKNTGTGGLAPGSPYYLSAATKGKITLTAPATVGQYVQELGVALSTTEMKVNIKLTILL
jgi:hypothetical protein